MGRDSTQVQSSADDRLGTWEADAHFRYVAASATTRGSNIEILDTGLFAFWAKQKGRGSEPGKTC